MTKVGSLRLDFGNLDNKIPDPNAKDQRGYDDNGIGQKLLAVASPTGTFILLYLRHLTEQFSFRYTSH
jgi:hypothetical protein